MLGGCAFPVSAAPSGEVPALETKDDRRMQGAVADEDVSVAFAFSDVAGPAEPTSDKAGGVIVVGYHVVVFFAADAASVCLPVFYDEFCALFSVVP